MNEDFIEPMTEIERKRIAEWGKPIHIRKWTSRLIMRERGEAAYTCFETRRPTNTSMVANRVEIFYPDAVNGKVFTLGQIEEFSTPIDIEDFKSRYPGIAWRDSILEEVGT